eukprot:43592-Eustigmatos_ZCMA.PRE.1
MRCVMLAHALCCVIMELGAQIRGREERTTFLNTFKDVFMFRTEHDKGLFKIVGAWGKAGHDQPYVM